jgi:hypothetical protein
MQRGQASWGVMEILIATIILGMSLGVVFYSLKNVEEIRCVITLKASMTHLQNSFWKVAMHGSPSTDRVTLTMPSCGDKSVEAVRFVYYKQKELCRSCPGQYAGCWVIEPTVYDYSLKKFYRLNDASVCVQNNMPYISLTTVTTGKCLGNQISNEPCPNTVPGCRNDVEGGVPENVFKGNANGDGAASDSNSIWSTFGRKPGDPRTFVFELSKSVEPSLSSSVQICPLIESDD